MRGLVRGPAMREAWVGAVRHTGTVVRGRGADLRGTAWAALCVLAALAGCTGPDNPSPQVTPPPASEPARTSGLFAVDSSTLGPVVIDGTGYLVYRSDKDSHHPSRSTCVGNCTAQWLPVPASANLRVSGIDRQLVGEYRRPDGTRQLTLAGWPLYGYAGDRMPGDANGQGLGGTWYVITPSGGKAG
jgi:predicted lipoprotein with Yx(FWY)xxD motif